MKKITIGIGSERLAMGAEMGFDVWFASPLVSIHNGPTVGLLLHLSSLFSLARILGREIRWGYGSALTAFHGDAPYAGSGSGGAVYSRT
jgi:hypothetical protein